MSINELTKRLNELGSSWEQFKQMNERRLSEISKSGNSDPLTLKQLEKINYNIDECKERIRQMEVSAARPDLGGVEKRTDDALCKYIRYGTEDSNLQRKALSVVSGTDGGYFVRGRALQYLSDKILATSPMRQLSSQETISTDSLDVVDDTGEAYAGWAQESEAPKDTNTPQIGKKTIYAYRLYAQPKATQKLLNDSAIDIESWLIDKIHERMSHVENTAFINGDGLNKPVGILNYNNGTKSGSVEHINSGADSIFTSDSIIKLIYSLPEEHSNNASFLMHRSTLQYIRSFKDASGRYLFQPGLTYGTVDTILGIPVYTADNMPKIAKDSKSIIIGDFKRGYKIVDREDITILRDPYTDKPYVKFYITKHVGGDIVNFDAFKILQLSA